MIRAKKAYSLREEASYSGKFHEVVGARNMSRDHEQRCLEYLGSPSKAGRASKKLGSLRSRITSFFSTKNDYLAGSAEEGGLVFAFGSECTSENDLSDNDECVVSSSKPQGCGTEVGQKTFLAANLASGEDVSNGVGTCIRDLSVDKVSKESRVLAPRS